MTVHDTDFEEVYYDESHKGKKSYKRMHTMKGDRKIPIAAMQNTHIENFINLRIEKMIEIRDSALYEVGETADIFFAELNGVQKLDKGTAVSIISSIMYELEPYFTELIIRGNTSYIMNIQERLESVLGRKRISNVGKNLIS